MKTPAFSRTLRAALSGAALSCVASVALADIRNYEFELVEPTVKAGADRTIAVKLVDKTTGKPVPDAVIFATRLDMAPDGMQEMATKITPIAGTEPGTYRFKATFGMEGRWQLSLGAKVQGETGTVENKLVIRPTNEARQSWLRIAAAVTARRRIAGVLARPSSRPRGATAHVHVIEQARAEPARLRSTIRIRTASRSIR